MFQLVASSLFVLFSLYLVVKIVKYWLKKRDMPPGPFLLPVKSLEDISKRIHIVFAKVAEEYGNIFTLEIPGKRLVIVNSIEIAREAFLTKKDDFAGRPDSFVFDTIMMGRKGIAMGDFSSTLVLQRKIVHSAIRMYQPFLEEKIDFEVNELFKRLPEGKPINPKNDVVFIALNVIFQMAVGERFERIDDQFKQKLDIVSKFAALIKPINILNIFPFLVHFPITPSLHLKEIRDNLHQYFFPKYHEHKDTYQEGTIRDLADALIKARQEAEKEDSRTYHLIDEVHIVMTLVNVFIAGFETSATALLWILLYLVKYPDIQSKIHQEMDSALGPNTLPSWKHRTKLPFLVATIDETLRKATIFPLLIPHKATKDTTLAGFQIPKGTTLMFNAWSMHRDEKEWVNPVEFNPSRFIGQDGQVEQIAGARSYVPFGMGRRGCVGEALAKQKIFVVASRLLHQYTMQSPSIPEITEDITGSFHHPPPFDVCFKSRR